MKIKNKEYVKALTSMPTFVKQQIKAHQLLIASNPDGQTSSPDQKLSEDKLSGFPDTDSVAQTGEEFHGEEGNTDHGQKSNPPPRSSQKQKGKKGKKKKKLKGKGSKSKKEIPIVENPKEAEEEAEEEVEEELHHVEDANVSFNPALEKAERDFNLTKEDILSDVDTLVKEDFLKIGFSRWSGTWLPIIQLSPYDTPPGIVRAEWMRIHNRVAKKKMPRLFYWYGTKRDESAQKSAFSLAPKVSVCNYDEGVKKGRNVIPDKTQKKIDTGKKLTDTETLLVAGLKEQEIELKLPDEERVEWIRGEEDYEKLSYTAPLEAEEKKDKGKVRKTKTDHGNASSKKRKRAKSNEVPVATDQTKNVKRKRKKEKSSGISNDDEQGKKKTPRSKRQKTDPVIVKEGEQDVAIQDSEIENLGDGEPDDSLIRESDANGVEEAPKSKKKSKKSIKRKKGLGKQRPPSTEDIKTISVKKEEPRNGDTLHGTNPEEDVETFETSTTPKIKNEEPNENLATDCDKILIPLKEDLRNAVERNDTDGVKQNLEDIRQNVGLITPLFIKEHNFGMLIKKARQKFDFDDEVTALARSVTKAIKKKFYRDKECRKGTKTKKEPKEDGGVQKPKLNFHAGINGHISEGDTNAKTEPLDAVMAVPKKTVVEVEAPKSSSMLTLFNKPPIRGTAGKKVRLQHKELPRWLTEDISSEPMNASFQNNPERTFAFEFFVMSVEVFVTKKDMNQATIARGLEDATHQMHKKDIKKYWEKVHAICGTIVGKSNKPGISLLADQIMKGRYSYPMEIIELPLKKLYESFEGLS
mmetsp:Transcript_9511/g.11113  ORF Transcript_9511/g.11113 Transcript_9511/m.11113 type:complete len:807 (+) Transcript_9511:2-2422(+)